MSPWHCAGTGSRSAPTWWRLPSRRPVRPWNRSAACVPTWCSPLSAARSPMRRPPLWSGPRRSLPVAPQSAATRLASSAEGRASSSRPPSASGRPCCPVPGCGRSISRCSPEPTRWRPRAAAGAARRQLPRSCWPIPTRSRSAHSSSRCRTTLPALPISGGLAERAARRGLDPVARRRPGARAGRRRRAARGAGARPRAGQPGLPPCRPPDDGDRRRRQRAVGSGGSTGAGQARGDRRVAAARGPGARHDGAARRDRDGSSTPTTTRSGLSSYVGWSAPTLRAPDSSSGQPCRSVRRCASRCATRSLPTLTWPRPWPGSATCGHRASRSTVPCCSRAQDEAADLFASAHHDVLAVRDGLATTGVAGFFAAGEIGPVVGRIAAARQHRLGARVQLSSWSTALQRDGATGPACSASDTSTRWSAS